MFKLTDNFKLYDTNLLPHTFSLEKHSATENFHASVDERGFVLKSIGNRWIYKTPLLKEFSLSLTCSFNYLSKFDPVIYIFFGYDSRSRSGNGIRFEYKLDGVMNISLVNVNRMSITDIGDRIEFKDFHIKENIDIIISITASSTTLHGNFGDRKFEFPIIPLVGNIAIERKNFVGEFIIKEISVSTDDDLEAETILPECTVKIPLRDGGDIPYEFTFRADKIGSQRYLFVQLNGGTSTREINTSDRPGQYMAELDRLTSPFVILRNGDNTKEFNLYNGTKIICDPNICWDCLKEFFNHPKFPISCIFPINDKDINTDTTISFGYEELSCIGYMAQSGGPSEFIFDTKGKLIYEGDKLNESVFELISPPDKYATTLIPKHTYCREAVIHHLTVNHYFHIDEIITLTMSLKTKLSTEDIKIEAEIRDVYDSKCLKNLTPEITISKWKYGYYDINAKIQSSPLPLGVYRILFTVYYGDTVYKNYNKVFEVFDKDANISPATASGLPFTFSMPNEQKWLETNTFDLWSPKPSCDSVHFISCVTNTPIEAEKQKIWELIHIFGRKWYAWLNSRVCRDWKINSHMETVKHCDYLYPVLDHNFSPRITSYVITTYSKPEFRMMLHDFLDANPEIAEKIIYKPQKISESSNSFPPFTHEELKNLLDVCHKEWFDFVNKQLLKMTRKQNEELKEINPKFKRAFYGPFPQYVMGTVSYHSAKAYGYKADSTLSNDIFSGFAVFEDYPSPCAYQTYRGAFAVMTFLLHCPDLVIYPEQYNGSDGGCIDGAVKFAYAPMGKYDTPTYFNSTHAFEYVFNTPHKTSNGYKYWSTYGFHRRDHEPEMAEKLALDWKTVIDNKPRKPLRTMGIIAEYVDEEDVFSIENIMLHGYTTFSNISEEGHGFIYDCARESGVNAPFVLKNADLTALNNDECDVLVIPSLKYASKETVNEIRRLYENGISLIAVSDICGLEDIFGVKENNQNVYVTELCNETDSELIYPNEAPFKYEAKDAKVIIWSENKTPVVLKKERALLINAPISKLGHECFEGRLGKTKNNVCDLFKNVLKEEIRSLSSPLVVGANIGITLFENEHGNTQLLAIDYSAYNNQSLSQREATIKINFPVKEIISKRSFTIVRDNDGYIKEIRFNILPHEAVMFRLL